METTVIGVFDNTTKTLYQPISNNNFLSSIILLLLILYASTIAPKLPSNVVDFLSRSEVRIFMFFLILYTAGRTASVALISSLLLFFLLDIIINSDKYMSVYGKNKDTGIPNEIVDSKINGVADTKFDKYDPDTFMNNNLIKESGNIMDWHHNINNDVDNGCVVSGVVEDVNN
jgi:hypothetical protein